MNATAINEMHAELQVSEEQCGTLLKELEVIDQTRLEAEQRHKELWNSWQDRVVEIGSALTEAKQQHGKGWKRDFESLGYSFSYTIATRYIACALHPEHGNNNDTVEKWAQASADLHRAADENLKTREARRKERAASRSLQTQDKVIEYVPSAELAAECADQVDSVESVADQLQFAFDSLNRDIQQSGRYRRLKVHWMTHIQALRDGIIPLVRMESSADDNDTVATGGQINQSELDDGMDVWTDTSCSACV